MATALTAARFLIQNPPISICPGGGGGVLVARETAYHKASPCARRPEIPPLEKERRI